MNPIYELRSKKLKRTAHVDLRRIIAVSDIDYGDTKLAVPQFRIVVENLNRPLLFKPRDTTSNGEAVIRAVRKQLISAWKRFARGRTK